MATADVQALVPNNVSNGVLMATADVQSMVSDGVLVEHYSEGDERYEVTKVPAESASLVQGAKKKILMSLKLESVLKDLDRVSDLLYLASMSVIGTVDLQGRIVSRQSDLSNLYTEFVNTITALQQDSRKVLGRLTMAYSSLLEAKEERAVHIFSKCGKNWSTMSAKLEELANSFKKMEDDTKEDAVLISRGRGDQLKKNEALQKLRAEMEKTKKEEEALRADINTLKIELREQKNAFDKEKAREHAHPDLCRKAQGALSDTVGGIGYFFHCDTLVEWAKTIAPCETDESKKLTNSILDILKKQAAKEAFHSEVVVQLVALTSRLLETNDQFTTVEHSALETATWALEIATQALGHIYVSLSEAKLFWDSKQRFCADLADPQVVEQIRDEMKEGDTPEQRLQYYKGDHFVRIAVGYLCEWSALVYVCGEYVVRADHAGLSVQQHIKASPKADEATKLVESLKKEIQDELKADAHHFEKKIKDLNAGAEKVKALIELHE